MLPPLAERTLQGDGSAELPVSPHTMVCGRSPTQPPWEGAGHWAGGDPGCQGTEKHRGGGTDKQEARPHPAETSLQVEAATWMGSCLCLARCSQSRRQYAWPPVWASTEAEMQQRTHTPKKWFQSGYDLRHPVGQEDGEEGLKVKSGVRKTGCPAYPFQAVSFDCLLKTVSQMPDPQFPPLVVT